MKTQSNNLLTSLSDKDLKALTTQVSETIATNTVIKKQFTTVDLWSIQKQRRMFATRN